MPAGRFHLITDTVIQSRYTHAQLAQHAIAGGADTIQYRSKESSFRVLLSQAIAVKEVCAGAGVPLIINDRVDLCLAVGAGGVHLGLDDMPVGVARRILGPEYIIGATVRNPGQAVQAARDGADYVGLGPIFSTGTKTVSVQPLGIQAITAVKKICPIPVIAIAGITAQNALSALQAGADGLAVIGAVCAAPDITAAARRLSLILA